MPPGGPRLPRRGLLTLAALAALPAACSRPSAVDAVAQPSAVPPVPTVTASPAPSFTIGQAATATRSPSASPPAAKAVPVSHGGGPVAARAETQLGAYLSLSGKSLDQSLALRRRQLARDYAIVHIFCAWGERFERPAIGDSTLMISWDGTALDVVNNGSQDRVIAAAARNLAAMGKPTLLRWGWEMNGNWFPWDGSHNGKDPGVYLKAWKRMHGIFRDEGAGNVAWVWSPNWNSGPDVSWNKMEHYYPGDSYVDWVGVSGYNFDGESPTRLFTPVVSAYGGRKPIIVSETAAIDHGGDSKAAFTTALSAYVRKTPEIGGLVWFDTNNQSGSSHDFTVDSSASSLAAFKTMARSPRFTA